MTTDSIARGWAVWALAVGQTLGYAALFYIFAALILPWHADLAWEKSTFAAGPMLAVLISAGLAPFLGRVVDRGFGPELMVGGAATGALGLLWLAQIETPRGYLLGWMLLGLAQGACLYEVCFAFLIRRLGGAARAAIVRVTLIAGLASTIAFPAGAAMSDVFGWRGAVLVAAGVTAFVTLPLHYFGTRSIRRATPPVKGGAASSVRAGLARVVALPGFWLLACIFTLVALNHWMMISFLVPIFVGQGVTPATAVFAAATVGPAQVVGRLMLLRYEARVGNSVVTRITLSGTVVAALILLGTGIAPTLVFAYTLTQGAALGVMTILRPVLIADVLGSEDYGTVAGAIQLPALLGGAAAPLVGALMLDGPGLQALLWLSLCLAAVAFGLTFALARVKSLSTLR